ncbi:MAG: GGDEF domain-containing protein [Deltaproteobacteria bacterium]|nr:GGDEF domain-containing protein [Deltaproteobacteria bacterium]
MADRDDVLDELIWSVSRTVAAQLDASLRIVRASRGLAELAGDAVERLQGRSVVEFLPSIKPDEIENVLATRSMERGVLVWRSHDRESRVMAVLVPTPDGALFFAEPISGGASPPAPAAPGDARREIDDLRAQVDYLDALNRRIRAEHVLTTGTGIFIRKILDLFVDAEIGRSIRTGRPFALLLCGVDRAQALDQMAGEDMRIKVVSVVAKVLSTRKRVYDLLGQFSPGEFFILQPENASADAREYAERIRATIEGRKVRAGSIDFKITLSFGIAHFHPGDNHYRDRAELVSQAEAALFAAASSGGNRIVLAPPAKALADHLAALNRP